MDQVRSELLIRTDSQAGLEQELPNNSDGKESQKPIFMEESSHALQACLAVAQKYFHLGFVVGLRFTADIADDADSEEDNSEDSTNSKKNAPSQPSTEKCRCSGLRKASSWPSFPTNASSVHFPVLFVIEESVPYDPSSFLRVSYWKLVAKLQNFQQWMKSQREQLVSPSQARDWKT